MEERTIYEKKLYRSRKNRVLGGICGGIGEYFEVDPVLIRVLSIVGAFITSGILVFAYIVSWLIIPEKIEPLFYESSPNSGTNPPPDNIPYVQKEPKGKRVLGIVLIFIGAFLLLDNIFPFFDLWDYWPLMLIGAGILLVTNSFNK